MQLKSYTTYLKNGASYAETLIFNVSRMSNIIEYSGNSSYTEFLYETSIGGMKDKYVITTLLSTVLTDTANYDSSVKISGITVIDVNGVTNGGTPTLDVNAISIGYADPSDAGKTYLMYDDGSPGLKRYYMNDALADIVDIANANSQTFGGDVAFEGDMFYTFDDTSGTPGDATINAMTGRAAIDATQSACTITNDSVSATSIVTVSLESIDATLTQILTVVPAAGSFTVTGNAAATADANFSFVVHNKII